MAYHTDAPEVRDIANMAFPDYTGKKFKVEAFRGPMELRSSWDGGSRDYYVIVNLSNGKVKPIPENGSGFGSNNKIFKITKLPPNFVVVEKSIFVGKDMGITIYINQENISKMLPAPDDTTWEEKVVLVATRSLKSSYGGVKDYRFQAALRDTGITKQEWDTAKENLIQKGMLNKAGAITDKGRNAAGNEQLWSLKKNDNPNNG
jgi:hypothetical protein